MTGRVQAFEVRGRELRCSFHGEGDPVLLVNGLGAAATVWQPLLDNVPEQLSWIVMDNLLESYDAARSLELPDVADLLDEWFTAIGIDRAHVLGISMGGTIAQHLAIRHPHRVRRLALASSWAHVDHVLEVALTLIDHCHRTLPPKLAMQWSTLTCFPPGYLAETPEALVDFSQVLNGSDEQSLSRSEHISQQVRACLRHDVRSELGRLSQETLVTVGALDYLVGPYHSARIAESIPRCRLHVFQDAGHAVMWTKPVEFADLHTKFFKGDAIA